ncbi:Gfo/Idh/MocA family protein [Ammoniphilus sp. CFH 90114]|uniref:Gfo/Idh/MocA family protein n=1 Tax=Ammoniphilus sp. CFH 90114 TaxID=2493665 RepID=UPI00100F6F2B|nr:Gfo/Idh/MocA family oxidoreductase [Ammoniphilus sp. CFH 90114]RXT15360.1 Gfo/Idh/MocA family oxidoreductase [Ammoniphilus sp. CFH 90114]
MQPVKLGMIGAGGIARTAHYRALTQLKDEVQVVAVADVAIEAAQQLAREFGIEQAFSNYQDLLTIEEMDAVLITVPNFLHSPVANDSMQAGKHVLCEKPMAINASEAEKMLEVKRKTGKHLMLALNNRFRKDIQHLKGLVERGEFGEIYHAKCGWMRRAGIPGWGGWFTTMSQSGGGPLIDIGVHMLDLALYLMGNPKPVSVVGSTYQKFGDLKHAGNRVWNVANPKGTFDVEDFATAFIRLDLGATLTLDVSWAANIEKENVFLNLIGTKSGASVNNDLGTVLYSEQSGILQNIHPHISFDDHQARLAMWKHFLHCVRTGEEPQSTPEQGMFINKILDAIYQSSELKKEIQI